METPLITEDGFPRSDIDIPQSMHDYFELRVILTCVLILIQSNYSKNDTDQNNMATQ